VEAEQATAAVRRAARRAAVAGFPADPATVGAEGHVGAERQKDMSELIFTAYHKTQIEQELSAIQERLHRHRTGEVGGKQIDEVNKAPYL
jgi:hypothetical protein